MEFGIHVVSADPVLRTGLAARLGQAGIGQVTAVPSLYHITTPPSGTIVTPVSECSLDISSYLLAAGLAVVVLAALPNWKEQAQYERLGATYVPMTIDGSALEEALSQLRDRSNLHAPVDRPWPPPELGEPDRAAFPEFTPNPWPKLRHHERGSGRQPRARGP